LVGITNAAAWQIPVPGLAGGYTGGTSELGRVRSASNEPIPATFDPGHGDAVEAKATGIKLGEGDIWYMRYPGGGGWGDPLEREPEQVANDVRLGAVSEEAAATAYGVVLCEAEPGYDRDATQRRRLEMRTRRIATATRSGDVLVRRVRLFDGITANGAYVAPRDEVELVESFEPDSGRALDVVYFAETRDSPLPNAERKIL